MKHLVGIPYVNRKDLLSRAVRSVGHWMPEVYILDNSADGEIWRERSAWEAKVIHYPGASLSFAQSMNVLQMTAFERGAEVLICMHTDAEAGAGTPEMLDARISEAEAGDVEWGCIFTFYDTMVAFNVRALRRAGTWDVNLPQYFSDNDYYRRLRLAGYALLESGLEVMHHDGGSATINSDPIRSFLNGVTFPLYEQYYIREWGGPPGKEMYLSPFNEGRWT